MSNKKDRRFYPYSFGTSQLRDLRPLTDEEVQALRQQFREMFPRIAQLWRDLMSDQEKRTPRALDNSNPKAKAHFQMDFEDWKKKCRDISVRALGKPIDDLMDFEWRAAYDNLVDPYQAVIEAAEADATDEEAADKVRALDDYPGEQ